MDDATELRSFLSKDLFDWLQGSDALDACDALLPSASNVYENLHTDHTPSLPVPLLFTCSIKERLLSSEDTVKTFV